MFYMVARSSVMCVQFKSFTHLIGDWRWRLDFQVLGQTELEPDRKGVWDSGWDSCLSELLFFLILKERKKEKVSDALGKSEDTDV